MQRIQSSQPIRDGAVPSSRTGRVWALAFLMSVGVNLPQARAARPMITDDARIVDAGSCQVETWVTRNRNDTEYWALPGCNFTGNLEITVGGARGSDADGTRTTDVMLQGKTLFKPLEANGWGSGLVFGTVRHPAVDADRNLIGDLYAYVPISFSLHDDRFVLHTNLGWLHEKEARHNRMTWGVGTETQITPRFGLIAETFGQNVGKPLYQVGLRFWVVPDRVQIDTTYGNSFDGRGQNRWLSIGLRLLSPALPR